MNQIVINFLEGHHEAPLNNEVRKLTDVGLEAMTCNKNDKIAHPLILQC